MKPDAAAAAAVNVSEVSPDYISHKEVPSPSKTSNEVEAEFDFEDFTNFFDDEELFNLGLEFSKLKMCTDKAVQTG